MVEFRFPLTQDISLAQQVQSLQAQFQQLWWESERSLPVFDTTYTATEQARREKQLERLIDGLIYELKHMPRAQAEQLAFQKRLGGHARSFAQNVLDFEARHLDFLENSGMIAATQEFAQMARRFDPKISGEDIYQAGRNVMTMNFIQLLMGLPVEVTPSVFAYSMLYPYTDNYLDDPAISNDVKRAFNVRFRRRLEGEAVKPANRQEEIINDLVGMIEGQFERRDYPLVWDSLLAIFYAQAHSLKLVAPGASPFEADVLGISFEKGGTSVLADGYLVAGSVSPEEAVFLYGYGAFTQLMDDLEDVYGDMQEGRMTIFTQTAQHWPLDGVTNRVFHFGRKVFGLVDVYQSPASGPLRDLIARSLDPVLIDTAGRAGKFYSRAYLKEMESHMPFRFDAVRKQRARLERHKVGLGKLVETII